MASTTTEMKECVVCKERFPNSDPHAMKKHAAIAHGQGTFSTLICQICDGKFYDFAQYETLKHGEDFCPDGCLLVTHPLPEHLRIAFDSFVDQAFAPVQQRESTQSTTNPVAAAPNQQNIDEPSRAAVTAASTTRKRAAEDIAGSSGTSDQQKGRESVSKVVVKQEIPDDAERERFPIKFQNRFRLVFSSASHPVQCELCSTPFETDEKLHVVLNHVKRHTKIRMYTCLTCDSTYPTFAATRLHMKRIHKENDPSGKVRNDSAKYEKEILRKFDECFKAERKATTKSKGTAELREKDDGKSTTPISSHVGTRSTSKTPAGQKQHSGDGDQAAGPSNVRPVNRGGDNKKKTPRQVQALPPMTIPKAPPSKTSTKKPLKTNMTTRGGKFKSPSPQPPPSKKPARSAVDDKPTQRGRAKRTPAPAKPPATKRRKIAVSSREDDTGSSSDSDYQQLDDPIESDSSPDLSGTESSISSMAIEREERPASKTSSNKANPTTTPKTTNSGPARLRQTGIRDWIKAEPQSPPKKPTVARRRSSAISSTTRASSSDADDQIQTTLNTSRSMKRRRGEDRKLNAIESDSDTNGQLETDDQARSNSSKSNNRGGSGKVLVGSTAMQSPSPPLEASHSLSIVERRIPSILYLGELLTLQSQQLFCQLCQRHVRVTTTKIQDALCHAVVHLTLPEIKCIYSHCPATFSSSPSVRPHLKNVHADEELGEFEIHESQMVDGLKSMLTICFSRFEVQVERLEIDEEMVLEMKRYADGQQDDDQGEFEWDKDDQYDDKRQQGRSDSPENPDGEMESAAAVYFATRDESMDDNPKSPTIAGTTSNHVIAERSNSQPEIGQVQPQSPEPHERDDFDRLSDLSQDAQIDSDSLNRIDQQLMNELEKSTEEAMKKMDMEYRCSLVDRGNCPPEQQLVQESPQQSPTEELIDNGCCSDSPFVSEEARTIGRGDSSGDEPDHQLIGEEPSSNIRENPAIAELEPIKSVGMVQTNMELVNISDDEEVEEIDQNTDAPAAMDDGSPPTIIEEPTDEIEPPAQTDRDISNDQIEAGDESSKALPVDETSTPALDHDSSVSGDGENPTVDDDPIGQAVRDVVQDLIDITDNSIDHHDTLINDDHGIRADVGELLDDLLSRVCTKYPSIGATGKNVEQSNRSSPTLSDISDDSIDRGMEQAKTASDGSESSGTSTSDHNYNIDAFGMAWRSRDYNSEATGLNSNSGDEQYEAMETAEDS